MRRPTALERLLRAGLDPVLERAMGATMRRGLRDPLRRRLAPYRRRALGQVLGELAPAVEPLAAAVVARDPGAVAHYDALLDGGVRRMRALATAAAREAYRLDPARIFAAIERPLHRDGEELMDDPRLPEDERAASLDLLDRLNRHAGSYDVFLSMIAPLLEAAERGAGGAPARLHDVAAGHGGFAIFLAGRLGARAALEASDIRPEYLALGRARAAELGVGVTFSVEDALALDGLAARAVDVITCTQSLHHFTPGMIARMIGEAARASRVGICFIDGERSWLTFGLLALATTLYGRNRVFVHDALVSVRRMFYEEELSLLAALAPGVPAGARVETGASPAHAFVRVRR